MSDVIRKPNRIITAKFNWSKEMLNILYLILEELEAKQSKELQKNLWGETEVKVPFNKISKGEISSYDVKKIIKRFSESKRWIDYEEIKDPETGKKIEKSTVLISGMIYEPYSKEITIIVPSLAMPVLLYLGDGFAKIEKSIAFSLKSEHSKRMYELCIKYKALGGFTYRVDEFKSMFGLSDKYGKFSALKAYVLNVAQRELRESADVYFTYKSDRGENRRKTKQEVLIFTVIDKNNPNNPIDKNGNLIYAMLCVAYPVITSDKALNFLNKVLDHKDFKKIEFRLLKLRDEFQSGAKTANDIKTLIPYILENDYEIK